MFKHRIQINSLESDLCMLKTFQDRNDYIIILYGAGMMGRPAVRFLKDSMKIDIRIIVDANPNVKEIEDIEVVSTEKFKELASRSKKKICAVVSVGAYVSDECVRREIDSFLFQCNVKKVIDVVSRLSGIIKSEWYTYFVQNADLISQGIEIYEDEVSRDTYYEYIKAYLEGHSYEGKTFKEEYKYFGRDERTQLYKVLKDEVWLNCGSYIGDTIFHAWNSDLAFKKIYAVEGNEQRFEQLRQNISFLPMQFSEKISCIHSFLGRGRNEIKVDEILKHDKVTLINMDIEGAEKDVICSGKKVIERDRPVLAVCVYHKKSDLLEIPKLISDIVGEYRFFLRKYPSVKGVYFDGVYELNELVLYAVPNERVEYQDSLKN